MRHYLLVLLLVFTATTFEEASAQFNSVPVFYDPAPSSINRWTIAVSPAGGVNDDSGKNFAFAVRLSRSISRLTVAAGVSALNPEVSPGDRDFKIQVMGNVAVRVLPSPDAELESADYTAFSIDLMAGIGYVSLGSGASEMNIPLGLGIAYTIEPESGGIGITPWAAPRVSLRRVEFAGVSATQTGVGFSAGVNDGFEGCLGFFLALDWVSFGESTSDSVTFPGVDPLTIGGGIRFRWGE